MDSDTPTAQVSVMLVRLERRDLVSSLVPERIGKARGRPRKVYSLTLGGKKALEMGLRFFTDSDFKKESMPYGEPTPPNWLSSSSIILHLSTARPSSSICGGVTVCGFA